MNFFRKKEILFMNSLTYRSAEERSVTQILLRAQGPNIRQAQSGIHVKKLQPIHDPLCFQNP